MKISNVPDRKVILITGSSSGFGRLTAETLAREGHSVYASMRDIHGRNSHVRIKVEQLAKNENLDISVIEVDVTNDSSVDEAVAFIIEDAGRIDVLINNAGVMNIGVTEAYTLQQVQQQFEVNFYRMVRTNRAVLPHMRKQKQGLLIQISSLAGRLVFPFFGVYCASKFAAEAMSEVYRYELSGFGIDSVILEPGPYGTHLLESAPRAEDKQRLEFYAELADVPNTMIKSFADLNNNDEAPDPQEVANTILRLIMKPTGQRPLRTVVGIDYGVNRLNDSIAPFQHDLLTALEMRQMEQPV